MFFKYVFWRNAKLKLGLSKAKKMCWKKSTEDLIGISITVEQQLQTQNGEQKSSSHGSDEL